MAVAYIILRGSLKSPDQQLKGILYVNMYKCIDTYIHLNRKYYVLL